MLNPENEHKVIVEGKMAKQNTKVVESLIPKDKNEFIKHQTIFEEWLPTQFPTMERSRLLKVSYEYQDVIIMSMFVSFCAGGILLHCTCPPISGKHTNINCPIHGEK